MALDIREASLTDTAGICKLLLEFGYDCEEALVRRRLDRILGLTDHVVYAAIEKPHGLVGFAHAGVVVTLLDRPFAELGALVVGKEHRRGGIGAELLDHLHDWALRRGIDDVVVRAQNHRKAAGHFFLAMGYSLVKEQKVYRRDLAGPFEAGERTVID